MTPPPVNPASEAWPLLRERPVKWSESGKDDTPPGPKAAHEYRPNESTSQHSHRRARAPARDVAELSLLVTILQGQTS